MQTVGLLFLTFQGKYKLKNCTKSQKKFISNWLAYTMELVQVCRMELVCRMGRVCTLELVYKMEQRGMLALACRFHSREYLRM